MTTDIQKSKTFEEKMKDRVKESIGDLMSDEDLQKIVERSLEEVFFKETHERNSYNNIVKTHPPLIHQIIKGLLDERVTSVLNKYIEDNADKVQAALDGIIKEGAGMALVNAMNDRFSQQLSNFSFQIQQNIEQGFQNRDL